jgi:hypothetical protein
MAAVDITRFMNSARSRLTGATDDALQLELFNVMDEFFKGSNVWCEDIDILIPGQDPANTIYELTSTGPSLIDKLAWVYEVPASSSIGRGPQIGAAMQVPGELTLSLQPTSAKTYRVTVILTVQDPVARSGYVTFPAWVLAKYRQTLLDGLLGKMYSQPSKPYTNTQLSVFHMRKFKIGTSSARVEWTRNNTYRQQAWRFPGFAGGSQRGSSGWGGPV